MVDHPHRALVPWPIVLAAGLILALVGSLVVVTLLLLDARKASEAVAHLGDYELESEVADVR